MQQNINATSTSVKLNTFGLSCEAFIGYWQGQEFDQIAGEYGLNHKTVRSYVNTYLAGGFALLCQPTVRAQRSQLSQPERTAFKAVLLSKRPFEVGLEGNIWTGQLRLK